MGYGGVALMMAIESACVPLPSEIIMPFSGYLVSRGEFSLWGVALAGALGLAREIARNGPLAVRLAKRAVDGGLWAGTEAQALARVNATLWDVEERLRARDAAGDFGADFVAEARSVYRHNDERAALKRALNERLGSEFVEQKSYTGWAG